MDRSAARVSREKLPTIASYSYRCFAQNPSKSLFNQQTAKMAKANDKVWNLGSQCRQAPYDCGVKTWFFCGVVNNPYENGLMTIPQEAKF